MSNKVPQIRFNGFTDPWEERKLKELGDIQTGNTPPTSDSDNYSLDGVLWVTPTDIKSLVISNTAKKLSQVGVTKARIAKAGSILVTSIASIGKNTLLRIDAGFNQQINSLTPTSENDSYFLLTQSEKWSEKMKQTAASATMQIVNKTDFSNISTYVPVHKEEQEKIGSFFKQLDDIIALHQRKLDLLKEQKKGYLQKMFPKNGAKVPELRFAGFADDWEERKLGDLATSFEYGLNASAKSFDGTHKYIRITDIDDSSRKFNSQSLTSPDIDLSSADNYKLKNGDILFARTGASVGKSYIYADSDGLVYYAGFLIRARIKSGVDSNFVFQHTLTSSYENFIRVTSQRSGQPGVNAKEYSTFEISVPSYEEQRKIGSFFKQLDDTITLHQRKLDLLKEQKKGFLEKMFV